MNYQTTSYFITPMGRKVEETYHYIINPETHVLLEFYVVRRFV